MVKLDELKLESHETKFTFSDNEPVVIKSLVKNGPHISDIELEFFGEQILLRDFADHSFDGMNGEVTYIPNIWTITNSDSPTFCAIVGISEVVFINFASKSFAPPFKLFRDNYDSGYVSLKAIGTVDGFLLVYESGVALFRHNGEVLWHKRLHWDDIFDRSDDAFLYFSSEHRKEGEEWRMKIADGEVLSGW
ncbi:MAG: hypothetical protein KDB79_08880 [Acidobacteria bacterium]|nr:hypothetical protein [Acidobacteriota bacterium]